MEHNTPPIHFKKVRQGAYTPTKSTDNSVGHDIKAPITYQIKAGTTGVVPTGLAVDLPAGQYGRLATKSHQAWKYSLLVLGGVIDPGYTQEIFVLLHVLGEKDFNIEKGEEFIQLIIESSSTATLKEVEQLPISVKPIGQYGITVQKSVKRLNGPKTVKKTTICSRYNLRRTKVRKPVVKTMCNCYN